MCFLITDGQSTEFIYLNFTLSFIGKKCQRHFYPFKKKEKRLFQIKKKAKNILLSHIYLSYKVELTVS